MSKTILALDQASKTTGYAVFIDGKLIAYNKFTFEDADMDVRLVKIRNKVLSLIEHYQPDVVVYEDIQHQANVANNVQTFKILAEVYGVIGELLEELNIPHTTLLATSWKSTLGIKGKNRAEQKRNAQEYVTKTYGVTPTQDESDAVCIGDAYLNKNQCAW